MCAPSPMNYVAIARRAQQQQEEEQQQQQEEQEQEHEQEGRGARTPMLPDSKASFFAMIFSSSVTTARSCSASFAQPSFRTSSSSDAIAVRTPTLGPQSRQQSATVNSQKSAVGSHSPTRLLLRSPQPKNMPCGQPSGRSSAL